MLLKISWRNIWRNKGRSFVVIGSIIVGIWALIFMVGFMNGFMVSYVNGAIKNEISHIQIHNPEFKKDYDIRYTIPQGNEVADKVMEYAEVVAVSPRSITNGMISSARKASGVRIYGVIPNLENQVTHHDSLIVEGDYFQSTFRNPVVIGKKLADELKVSVRSKIVLTFHDKEQNLSAGAFRVVGIIDTTSPVINGSAAFVRRDDLNKIMGFSNDVHEIAIFLTNPELVDTVKSQMNSSYADLQIESWREISPELELFLSMTDSFLWVLIGIIMIALIFGIINSMLMAVLERFREIGMLMAVGMNKVRIYFMIVIETVLLSLVGGPLGIVIALLTMKGLNQTGIDLSDYSEGLREFGYSSILYPVVDSSIYLIVTIGVVITAILGALYPAYKAIKLNPIEALHTV